MMIPAEVRKAHAQLSEANGRFLDYAQEHPELLQRSTFEGIERFEEIVDFPYQAWPTFISSDFMAQVHRWNQVLCHLVKVIPHRVFGSDAQGLADFYGTPEKYGRLLVAIYTNPRWVEETLGRGDFILTEDGFKCMEYNLSSRLGGWQSSWRTDDVLSMEPVRRFVEAEGVKVRPGHTLRTLMGYLIKRGIQRFATQELNIVALSLPDEFTEHHGQLELFESMKEEKRSIEKLLGGKVRCRFLETVPERFEERDGKLFLDEHRVHAVLEGGYADAGEVALSCWLKGTVDLYNSPGALAWNDKRNLALLSELEDSSLLNEEERQVVKAHLPWTRRVSTDRLHAEAVAPVSREEILQRREELVLKPANLNAGKSVFLGRHCEPAAWEEVLDQAYAEGNWLAQELLEGHTYYYQGDDGELAPYDLIWGFFLFGDRDGGPCLRLGPKHASGPVNAMAGATLGLTINVDEG